MRKAVILSKIYLEIHSLTTEEQDSIKEALVYKYTVRAGKRSIQAHKKTYNISGDGKYLLIPNTRKDLVPKDFVLTDLRKEVPVEIPIPKFTPRPSQAEIVDAYVNDGETSGIVQAVPGFGKSITALQLAYKLQQKTLIVTTTTTIKDMWVAEIEEHFGFKPGIMTQGKYIRRDSPIVVGNFQTVVKYAENVTNDFGLLIIDEMHKCVANTFTEIISVSKAKYRVGLSATLKRTDGLQILFGDYFGHTRYQPPAENVMKPKVLMLRLPVQVVGWATNNAKAVSTLADSADYQTMVVDIVNRLNNMGRTTLVISNRNSILKIGAEVLGGALVTGTNNKTSEERAQVKKDIYSGAENLVWGSQSIFSEGVSWNPLDTLVLGTPISSHTVLEQCIGRVCREHSGKGQPLIIDLYAGGTFNAANNRMDFYNEHDIPFQVLSLEEFLK